MKRKLLSVVLSATLLSTALVGCGSKAGGDSSNEIVLGGITPLTGPVASYGQSVKNGADLFVEEINANGGIDGKTVVIKYEDDEGDPTKAISAYDKLVNQEEVSAIIGPVTSGSANAVAPKATVDGIPMITPTGTEGNITRNGGEYVFRTCYIDSVQGQAIAKYATEDMKAKTIAILYNVGSDYSRGIAETIKADFEAAGGKVVQYVSYNDGDKDFSAQLTNVKGSNPDVIALPDYYNVVSLIADQARKIGIEAPFIGGDGWDSPELLNLGGSALEGSVFVNHYSPFDTDEAVQAFVTSYKEKFGAEPDAFAALAYSTLQLYKVAIEAAGSTDPVAVKDAITAIETETITGTIKFDEVRNPIKSVSVIKIEDGSQKLLKKVNP